MLRATVEANLSKLWCDTVDYANLGHTQLAWSIARILVEQLPVGKTMLA